MLVTHISGHIKARDFVIVFVAICLILSPFIPHVGAADGPVYETPLSVNQRVRPAGMISEPLAETFAFQRQGLATGSVTWSVSSSDSNGFKLVVSTTTDPAMRATDGTTIPDYDDAPAAWDVGDSERAFGFSVVGQRSRADFGDGTKWRGFNGRQGIEVARRRGGASEPVRTTIRLASEMGRPLPDSVNPTARVVATAVANL